MADDKTTPPPNPTSSPSSTGQSTPVEARFQNYHNLRAKIQAETLTRSRNIADNFLSDAGKEDFLIEASQIISERTVRHLPSKSTVTREDIHFAASTAAEELAQKEIWFDTMLSRKKRESLVAEIANSIDIADPRSLQLAVEEQEAYLDEVSNNIPQKTIVVEEIANNLQTNANVDKPTSHKLAETVVEKVDRKALFLGASPDHSTQVIIKTAVQQHLPNASASQLNQVTNTINNGKGGTLLTQRRKATGSFSKELIQASSGLVRVSDLLEKELKTPPSFNIADTSGNTKGTTLFLKKPITTPGGDYIYKIQVHDQTQATDPNRPSFAATPIIDPTKINSYEDIKSFELYDPKTKQTITITKDQIGTEKRLSIADETDRTRGTSLPLKQPITVGGKSIDKIELHNRTQDVDPNLPSNAAKPIIPEGTRVRNPKSVSYNAVESFNIYDPTTKQRVSISKDQIDEKPHLTVGTSTETKGTTLSLKQPIEVGGKTIDKIEVQNQTSLENPHLSLNAAKPLVDPANIKTLEDAEKFQFYDKKTKQFITINKDQIDDKIYRGIDPENARLYIKLSNQDSHEGLKSSIKWMKNPTGEAAKYVLRPITSRVGKVINKVTAPVRKVANAVKNSFGKVVNVVTAPVRAVVNKTRVVIGKAVNAVITPIKKAAQKVIVAGLQLIAKALIKIGLGGLVAKIEQAALAGTGVGIPLLLLQETVGKGISSLISTIVKFGKDIKKTFETFQSGNLFEGIKQSAALGIDTIGATVGAIGGAITGTAGGAVLGAILGSAIPIIGNIAGAILGGIGGAIFGAGTGAKAGYELRKKIEKALKGYLSFRYLLQLLNPWNLLWMLAKAAFLFVAGVVIGFFKTIATAVVKGAIWVGKGALAVVKFAGSAIGQAAVGVYHTASQVVNSIITQLKVPGSLIHGTGNLLEAIPSNIAKAFNVVTGKAASTIQSSVAIEKTLGTALTQGPSTALTITVPATIASGIILSTMVYTVLISVYYVHPTEVTPYRPGLPAGGNVVRCNTDEAGADVTDEIAASINNASVQFLSLPNTVMTHGLCITPTMMILHSSAGYDNVNGAEAVLNYHNSRGSDGDPSNDVGCHLASDTNNTLLMLHFYEHQVQMAYCAGPGGNPYGIQIEMAGEIKPSDINFTYTECPPPTPPGPPNPSDPDDNLYFVGDPPDNNNPGRTGHPCHPESELGFDAICRVMTYYQIPASQVYQHKQIPGSTHGDIISNDLGGTRGDWVEDWLIPKLRSECTGLP